MAINFPDPNASPWYNDPANGGNGVTYVYTTGGYWTAVQVTGTNAIDQTTGDARYVNVSGDTMTGALLLDNAASVSAPDLSFDGDANTGIYSPGADQFGITTNGTLRFVIDGSSVGINTTLPQAELDVHGVNGSSEIMIRAASGSNTSTLRFLRDNFSGGAKIRCDGDTLEFLNTVLNQERMRIDSSGNVGIGTTSPGALLDLGTSTPILRFSDSDTTGYHQIQSSNSNFIINADPSNADTGSAISFKVDNSDAMRIDSSGNVGIGTTSPGQVLDVVGDAQVGPTSGTALLYLGTRGFSSSLKYNASTGDLDIAPRGGYGITFKSNTAGTTEWMRIDSSGNVGIGTNSPATILSAGTGSGTNAITINGAGSSTSKNQLIFHGGGTNNPSAAIEYDAADPGLAFQVGNYSSLGSSERMRIDSSGKLLVGLTSDQGSGNLQVKESIAACRASNSTSGSQNIGTINFSDARPGTYGYIKCQSDGVPGTNDYPGRLMFATTADSASSPTERLRIDSSGRLLIGRTSAVGNSSKDAWYSRLQVQGNTADTDGRIAIIRNADSTGLSNGNSIGLITFNDRQGGYYAKIQARCDGSVSSSSDTPGLLSFFTTADGASSPTERMRIDNEGITTVLTSTYGVSAETTQGAGTSYFNFRGRYGSSGTPGSGVSSFLVWSNGNVQNTNNSYTAISDVKLKENIVDANPQWDDIKGLQVRNYNLKEGQTHTQIGVVAQEVELISPGLVYESPDLDDDGNDLGTTTKSVNYSVLYMKAVKALQEAMERIETLEQRLTDAGL